MPTTLNKEQRTHLFTWFTTALSSMMEERENKKNVTEVHCALHNLLGNHQSYSEFCAGNKLISDEIRFVFTNPSNIIAAHLSEGQISEAKEYFQALCNECLEPEINLNEPGNLMKRIDTALGYETKTATIATASGSAATSTVAPVATAPSTTDSTDNLSEQSSPRPETIKLPVLVAIRKDAPPHIPTTLRDYRYNAVITGNSNTGKTEFLEALTPESSPDFIPTVGVDLTMYTINPSTKIYIHNTAGTERFRSLTSAQYKGNHCLIFMASTNRTTADREAVQHWREQAKEEWQRQGLSSDAYQFYTVHNPTSTSEIHLEPETEESFERAFNQDPIPFGLEHTWAQAVLKKIAEHLSPTTSPTTSTTTTTAATYFSRVLTTLGLDTSAPAAGAGRS